MARSRWARCSFSCRCCPGPATSRPILESWRWADWNHLRITCVGRLPVITTWVNGQLVAELNTATIAHPHFDPDAVTELLGPTGHIAFEVHDNDLRIGEARWAPEARCRRRKIRIRDLS